MKEPIRIDTSHLSEYEFQLLMSLMAKHMDMYGRRPPMELIERWLGIWSNEADYRSANGPEGFLNG